MERKRRAYTVGVMSYIPAGIVISQSINKFEGNVYEYIAIVVVVCLVLTSFLMYYGLYRNKPYLLLPFMISWGVFAILAIGYNISILLREGLNVWSIVVLVLVMGKQYRILSRKLIN
jgi:hypothetical protein